MTKRDVINPGYLQWSGEHWINYLRLPGDERDSGMVSLYHTRYSPAGEGTTAFVDIRRDGRPPLAGVYTDNRETAAFVQGMIAGRGSPFDRELPLVEARIYRQGDIRQDPAWVIETDETRIVSTWLVEAPPVIVEGPAPTFGPDRDFFTLLFFTDEATITLDGELVPGRPYVRDIWRPSIGGERSSCVFALAETMIIVPET